MNKKDSAAKTEKRLALQKETLLTLTEEELQQAVGGRNIWRNGRRVSH